MEEKRAKQRMYLCIDLKSFYASVECCDRGLDPFAANLVVADPERTDRTICLAVSPAMKELGVPGRCRVFELPKNIDYIMAPPRMQRYIDVSVDIYGIYLKYISREDIHVYSIDEVFMDVTDYLFLYGMTAWELGRTITQDVLMTTGVSATCGIGTNLYLAKIAMDILAKHAKGGMAELDEESYRCRLWDHRPLTDFWRIGRGTTNRLAQAGIHTMREIAQADEDLLYGLFGVDAELLIDHAWGREPALMRDIKHYRPHSSSLGSGQVLPHDTDFETGRLLIKEMTDQLCLDLVERCLVTDSVTLHISYSYRYERRPAHGTAALPVVTSSCRMIMRSVTGLYDRIVDPGLTVRRLTLTFNHTMEETCRQYDLFTDPEEAEKEHALQRAMLQIRDRYGKNAILRGMDLEEGARTMERNRQIGGHRADAVLRQQDPGKEQRG
ncbi:MAG: DNA repair protein [Lachnospiraceae bacterium]|nr:DNA repair protein [Lachnospiraceae bacterium]